MALSGGLTPIDGMFDSVADLQASKSRVKRIVSSNDGTNIQFYTVSASDLGSGVVLDSGLFANPIGVASLPLNIATPVNALPVNAATDVSTTPTLTASAFSGTDIHIHSIWRVYSDSGGTVQVYSSGASNDLVSHTVPASANLPAETELFFDVQYVGVEAISSKSTLTSFTTELAFSSVFAITLTSGTSAELSVISGLDFAGSGGLDWTKKLTDIESHALCDTERLATKLINSDTTAAEITVAQSLKTFNSDGFTLGTDQIVNATGDDYVHFQWIKQAGRFDVVKYIGDGIPGRTVAIELDDSGSAVFGMAIVKDLDNVNNWRVQHKDLGGTDSLILNLTTATSASNVFWNDVSATTTEITLGTQDQVNGSGRNYVAYLFAHNPTKGVFCGSYTGTGATGNAQTLGFQAGLVMIKRAVGGTSNWTIVSTGMAADTKLLANLTAAETAAVDFVNFTANGFSVDTADTEVNNSGDTYIFMAWADPAVF